MPVWVFPWKLYNVALMNYMFLLLTYFIQSCLLYFMQFFTDFFTNFLTIFYLFFFTDFFTEFCHRFLPIFFTVYSTIFHQFSTEFPQFCPPIFLPMSKLYFSVPNSSDRLIFVKRRVKDKRKNTDVIRPKDRQKWKFVWFCRLLVI